MPKRKTVSANVANIERAAKKYDWSSAAIARKVGKHDRWLSEVKRGRNLPSPEEAARMCAILQVRPEEILTEPDDIELVQGLIDSQREKPSIETDEELEEFVRLFKSLSPEEKKREIAYLRERATAQGK